MPNNVTATIKVDSSQALAKFKGLESAMTKASLAGNLMATGITSGLSAVVKTAGAAASGITNAFKQAGVVQMEMAATAGDFAKLTGMSYADASKEVQNFSERMDKIAARLPGATEDFKNLGRGIMDNLLPAFKDAAGELDSGAFNASLDAITESATLRANFSNVGTNQAGQAISKLISGNSSISELRQLEFFEKNPAVIAFIEAEAEKAGGDLKTLGSRKLVSIAETALKVNDDVLNAARNSVGGIMEGFKDSLFSPTQGVFGVMRDLDTATSGNQTVFASFSLIVKKIFGDNGIFALGSQILNDLGLTTDPMQSLANALGKVGAFLDNTRKSLQGLANLTDDTRGIDASKLFSDIGGKLGAWLASQFNNLTSTNLDGLGERLGAGMTQLVNGLSNFIADIDMIKLSEGVLRFLGEIAIALVNTVQNVDWGKLLEALATVALVIGAGILAATAAGAISLSGGILTAIAAASVLVTAALDAAFMFMSERVSEWKDSVSQSIASVADALRDVFNAIRNRVQDMLNKLPLINISGKGNTPNRASGQNVGSFLAAIGNEMQQAPGTRPVVANDSEVILNRSQQFSALGMIRPQPTGNNFTVNNLVVQAGETTDPKALANAVMRELNNKWTMYQQSQIATSF
jgi:hypothetical protein